MSDFKNTEEVEAVENNQAENSASESTLFEQFTSVVAEGLSEISNSVQSFGLSLDEADRAVSEQVSEVLDGFNLKELGEAAGTAVSEAVSSLGLGVAEDAPTESVDQVNDSALSITPLDESLQQTNQQAIQENPSSETPEQVAKTDVSFSSNTM